MKEAENFPENIGTLLRVHLFFKNSDGFLNEFKYPESDSLLPYCMTDPRFTFQKVPDEKALRLFFNVL
jgi:hypothetical protein